MKKTLIIAEAGVNHNGSLSLAKEMVDVAVECGVDIVKFQTAIPEQLVSKFASKAEYQITQTGALESQLEMIKKITLSFDEFISLERYCSEKGIIFLSTPFDIPSINFLKDINISCWKIPSGEITNYPYLVEIAKTNLPVILSTGMSEIFEIQEAIDVLKKNGVNNIALMHCNTEYPTPMEDVNLKAMITMKNFFDLDVGYSDHTLGIEVPIAAVAMGATIIEKHFTLSRKMIGPDHQSSLEPSELKEMVKKIRNIELALGTGVKTVSSSERKNIEIARKSIIASRKIFKGEIISVDNITTKRPGTGINPMNWNSIIGGQAIRDFEEDELIEI